MGFAVKVVDIVILHVVLGIITTAQVIYRMKCENLKVKMVKMDVQNFFSVTK